MIQLGTFMIVVGVLLWDHFNSSSGVGKNARNDVELWIAGFPNVNEKQSTKLSHLTRSHKISESPQFTSPTSLQKKTKTGTPGEQSLQQQQTPLKTQTTNNIKQHNLLKPFAPPHQKKTNPLARNLFFLTSLSQMLPRLRREYLPTFILEKLAKCRDRGR